jgi:hypothetical protein
MLCIHPAFTHEKVEPFAGAHEIADCAEDLRDAERVNERIERDDEIAGAY